MSGEAPETAIVLKGYPRLSETFIAKEIHALEQRGLAMLIVSLRHPTDAASHPVHDEISAPVLYLPEYLYQEPRRVFHAWREMRKRPDYRETVRTWLRDLRRDITPNRVRRFGQALVLAHELPDSIQRLHAHFLHTPASVARYAALLTGRPWSASAHAVDVWTTPHWELVEKLDSAAWAVTCTQANQDYLRKLTAQPDKVSLAYHGLDLGRFAAPPGTETLRDGHDINDPVVILSVGRAVEKKGYFQLLDALARLPHDVNWRFVHIGNGELRNALMRRARRLGIDRQTRWLGSQPQEKVLAHYRIADLFVLPSRIARNGDRDGLPNVLMEAQSQGLACVATHVSAIPEFLVDNETALLSEPDDIEALVVNLRLLIINPMRRRAMGLAGQRRVAQSFRFERCIQGLAAKFGLAEEIVTNRVG